MSLEAVLVFLGACGLSAPWMATPRPLTETAGRSTPRRGPAIVATAGRLLGRRRADRRRRTALPLVLELLAREVRSGVTMSEAFANVAATADEPLDLDLVVSRLRSGELLGSAIDWWVARFDPDAAALVAGVFHLGAETGSAVADALDRAVEGIRARAELADEVRALTAQSRASASLVAVAPLGFGAVLIVAEPSAATFLFTSALGIACLVVGLLLDVAGFWWMHRLVDRVVS